MSNIKFKIAAKTDVGRVRKNNEDNLQAASDLTTAPMQWVNDMECDLGDKGALLVVADGMGGMNAGEVASEIAIKTIKEFFAPNRITSEVIGSKVGIETFMKRAIQDADVKIKLAAHQNPEHKGMGTTIVIAWLLDGKLYVAWCGDSRAYIFNKINGLRQISKDHSYVQTLVDKGKISKEDAFDFPDSNIITRCLSDSNQKARPDTIANPIDVCNDDIILLCTDGLSGMIRDHEIEQILAEHGTDLSVCADELIAAACEASGDDNITVALCKVLSGAMEPKKAIRKNKLSNTVSFTQKKGFRIKKKPLIKGALFLLLMGALYIGGFINGKQAQQTAQILPDSTSIVDSLQQAFDSLIVVNNDTIAVLWTKLNNLQKEKEDAEKKLLGDTLRLFKENSALKIINKQLKLDLDDALKKAEKATSTPKPEASKAADTPAKNEKKTK